MLHLKLGRHIKLDSHPGPSRRGGGEMAKFSRVTRRLGGPLSLKNTGKGVLDGFFLTSYMHKIHFWPGFCPGPCLGSLRRSPDSLLDGKWTPSPRFLPLDAFIVSISAHTAWGCDRAMREWFLGPRCSSRRACSHRNAPILMTQPNERVNEPSNTPDLGR